MYSGPPLISSEHNPPCIVSCTHILVPLFILSLDSTITVLGQSIGGRHTTKIDALVVSQLAESLKPDVEPARSSINGNNVDSLVNVAGLVVQLVAFATVAFFLACIDGRRSSNKGKVRQTTECTNGRFIKPTLGEKYSIKGSLTGTCSRDHTLHLSS